MQDTNLYEAVIGLESPWEVVHVCLKSTEETVEVEVSTTGRHLPCPVCGNSSPQYDTRTRRWRHLDTCQFQTILKAKVPRVKCLKHGVRLVQVPWADRNTKFTALFEARVIRWLQEASISAVSALFGLSWTAVDGIKKRAVRRGIKRRFAACDNWATSYAQLGISTGSFLPSAEERRAFAGGQTLPVHMGIDETSFQKRHEYVTVVCKQDGGHVAMCDNCFQEMVPLVSEELRSR